MAADVGEALFTLAIVIIVAKLSGELFERVHLPSVVGELLAGIAIGPALLGWAPSPLGEEFLPELLFFLGEIGVIILLFEVGLESDLRELLHVGTSSLGVAGLGLIVSFAAGFAGSWALAQFGYLPASLLFHVFIGAALTATSVGITARILSDRRKLGTNEARILLGAAVLDDLAGLLMLTVIGSLVAVGTIRAFDVGLTIVIGVGFLVLAIVVGLLVAPWLARTASRFRTRGGLLAVSLAAALFLAYAADEAGLAAIVGAFVAGVAFAQSGHSEFIYDRVRPLGDVFIPVFFVVLGLMVDASALTAAPVPFVVVAGVLTVLGIVAKYVSGYGVSPEKANRVVVGIGMVPRGEVGFIFVLLGLREGVFPEPWQYAALLVVMLLTTVVAPILLQLVASRVTWHEREAPTSEPSDNEVMHS